jgi:hypothetical protein
MTSIIDKRHNNIMDDDITQLLEDVNEEIARGLTGNRVFLNFSFNRLGQDGLAKVVKFMETHPQVR